MSARRPNTRPWAIAGLVIVIGGFAVALVSGGGTNNTGSPASPAAIPSGGQMTAVTHAPAPRPGDRVVAAGSTRVHGVDYRVVLSTPAAGAPLFINEYVGRHPKLLQRFRMPYPWTTASKLADFSVEADPEPNPADSASLAVSWFVRRNDLAKRTQYFGITTHGIELH